MALKQESQKISVKITESDNKFSKSKIDIIMDISNVVTLGSEIRSKTRKFKKEYLELIEDAKKIASAKNQKIKKKKKFSSIDWWNLGKLLDDFNKKIENEFVITNYTQAISRDLEGFELSNTEVGVIRQFARYFRKEEVLDEISIAHYRDFTWKRNQLSEHGILRQEKNRLVKMGKEKKLPDHKKYRKELQLLITSKTKRKKQR